MNCLALSLALIVSTPPSVETEKAPRTQVYVCTTPPGAQIAVDGQPRVTSPHLFDVPPGVRKMTIDVVLDDHYPKKRQVIIRGGRITRVMLDLTRKPQTSERAPSPAVGVTTESISERLENLPPGWTVLKSFVVPRDQTAAIEKRLGGRIKHLSNTFLAAHNQRVQVNVIECPGTEDADRVHRAVLGMKGDPAFCLRFDGTIVEFVGTFDAAFARRAAVELGLRDNPITEIGSRHTEAEMKGMVEDFFRHNYRDVTSRETIEWGDFENHQDGSSSIRYKFRATIWGKDVKTLNQVFTFDAKGKFVSVRKLEQRKPDRLVVEVAKGGSISVEGRQYNDESLPKMLRSLAQENPDLQVHLRTDRELPHQRAVSLMDLINNAAGQGCTISVATVQSDIKILDDKTGGPEKARLDFRIAATRNSDENPGLSDEVIQRHVADLGAHGPDTQRESDGEHAWFELRNEIPGHLIVAKHDGRRYALLSTRAAETMAAEDEGRRAWGLTQVSAAKDHQGHPSIKLAFDEAGARRMMALTTANLRRPLAILIDEKVVSAPRVMTSIGRSVEITGRFTEAEVKRLVTVLQAACTR